MTEVFYLCYTYIVLIHYIFIVIVEPEMNLRVETIKRLIPLLLMILVLLALVLYGRTGSPPAAALFGIPAGRAAYI